MSEAIAALGARQRTEALACGALPDSPVRPDPPTGRATAGGHALLRAASAALRRLADRLEPAEGHNSAAAPSHQ